MSDNENILSFIAIVDEEPQPEPKLTGIWVTLHDQISAMVKKDGIDKNTVQPGEIEDDVFQDAVETIYSDVAEFYYWYFNSDDDRTAWLGDAAASNWVLDSNYKFVPVKLKVGPGQTVDLALRDAVAAVVKDNLTAMRDADELPAGVDQPHLEDVITDNLSKYAANWQSWYYDERQINQIDDYFEQKSVNDEIYLDDSDTGYGQLSNIVDNRQYDGITDVPFIGEDLPLE